MTLNFTKNVTLSLVFFTYFAKPNHLPGFFISRASDKRVLRLLNSFMGHFVNFFVYISLTQPDSGFFKLQNQRVVTPVLQHFWCPNLVKTNSILSKVEDLLHNLCLVRGFRRNVISYSVMEFCKYLTWWHFNVSEILNDVLYLQNKNYFYISVGWFCWYILPKNIYNCYHRQANAKHFENFGFWKFTSFYRQKSYKTEPSAYNLTKFGQKVQNKITRNYTESQVIKFCRNVLFN